MAETKRKIRVNQDGVIVYDSLGRLDRRKDMDQKALMCHCGDCKHWEILSDGIKCMTCGDTYSVLVVLRSAQDQAFTGAQGGKATFQNVPA